MSFATIPTNNFSFLSTGTTQVMWFPSLHRSPLENIHPLGLHHRSIRNLSTVGSMKYSYNISAHKAFTNIWIISHQKITHKHNNLIFSIITIFSKLPSMHSMFGHSFSTLNSGFPHFLLTVKTTFLPTRISSSPMLPWLLLFPQEWLHSIHAAINEWANFLNQILTWIQWLSVE